MHELLPRFERRTFSGRFPEGFRAYNGEHIPALEVAALRFAGLVDVRPVPLTALFIAILSPAGKRALKQL